MASLALATSLENRSHSLVHSLTRYRQLALDLEGLVQAFTPSGSDPDSVFNTVLVLLSKRANVEIGEIPGVFTPITGKWRLKSEITISLLRSRRRGLAN